MAAGENEMAAGENEMATVENEMATVEKYNCRANKIARQFVFIIMNIDSL